jgi:glycosyltransferase involved in cell wall biosynthesis
MMKIEVVSFTGDSGLADYSVSLARALAKSVNTTVVTAQSLSSRFDQMGFNIERVFRRSRHYPIDIITFFIGALKRRPDYIIFQGPLKFAAIDACVIRLLSMFKIGTVITVHDVLPHYPKAWSKLVFGFYYRSFKRVIVHSQAALLGVRELGVKAEILIVPHGIYDIFDLTGIKTEDARKKIIGINKNDFVALFFGHLESRKGLMEFIDVASAMKDEADFKFLIAGSNSLSQQGQAYVDRLELAKKMPNVIVHDHRIAFEDVETYFSGSDLVCLPYLEGTTSGVLKLALAFTKPVVATRVGDFPEQVPLGAGEVIEIDGNISESLRSAIYLIRNHHAKYCAAMGLAAKNAQWSDIASKIIIFISEKR